jgi:hypothetical protein
LSAEVPEELAPLVWSLAAKEFGEDVTPQAEVLRWIKKGGIVHSVTVVSRIGDDLRTELTGFFDILPLTISAATEIKSGRLRGSQIVIEHMESDQNLARTFYLGAIVGTNLHARASMVSALDRRMKELTERGALEFLTRPITRDGLRLAKKKGFRKLTNDPDIGALFGLSTANA